jgi:hypothetical protein
MVAAQMIDGAIADVRKQLGASYGLDATLFESRLSTHVRIGGFVAAERAQEALALVRERIGRLAAGDAAAAALFVAARRDVMARLASVEPGASALASLAESAVELGRPLGANLTAAEDARRLTPSEMASELGAIDRSGAGGGVPARPARGGDAGLRRARTHAPRDLPIGRPRSPGRG